MANTGIPVCPLMSAGNEIPIICTQDRCAWYIANLKKCAMYVIGHNEMLELKKKFENKTGE